MQIWQVNCGKTESPAIFGHIEYVQGGKKSSPYVRSFEELQDSSPETIKQIVRLGKTLGVTLGRNDEVQISREVNGIVVKLWCDYFKIKPRDEDGEISIVIKHERSFTLSQHRAIIDFVEAIVKADDLLQEELSD